MHQRKSKRVLIYLFLLLLVGSINNIGLNNINFSNISKIKVLGLGEEKNKFLLENIYDLNLGNILFIDENKIKKIIETNSLVEKYDVFKIYPSDLYVNIQKTNFLARINKNGANYIIGSNGKLSDHEVYKESLPYIFGNPKIKEFLLFKSIIDASKFEYSRIENFYYFPTRRWDIELKNSIIIKLPEQNVKDAVRLAFEFLNNKTLDEINVIDARVKNQIILND